MIRSFKTRSTDLSVLRMMLLDEVEISKDTDNEINVNDISDLDDKKNINVINSSSKTFLEENENDCNVTKTKYRAKKSKDESPERQPFYVTRINSHHKDNSEKKIKSIDNEDILQNNVSIYKSVHYKNIVQKEERLQDKYRKLTELLQKDIVARTAAICDQSMNEARQLIQNSLAASRIVSSFVTDSRYSGVTNQILPIPDTTVSSNLELNDSFQCFTTIQDPFHPPVTNSSTSLYGYEAMNPNVDRSTKCSTDNRLNSEEPFIQNWLQSKEKEERDQKRIHRQQLKIERAITMNAERVLEQRKAASEEAFKTWCKRKSKEVRRFPLTQSGDARSASPESDAEVSLPQAGRQPRATHNFVFRRPNSLTRPKTAATFTIRTDLRMKLTGHKVDLSMTETNRSMARLQPSLRSRDLSNKQRPQTAVPGPRKLARPPTVSKSPSRRHSRRKSKVVKMRRNTDMVDANDDRENTTPEMPEIGVLDGGGDEAVSDVSLDDYDDDWIS